MNKIKVLYIDDEQHNLNAFKSSFRRSFDVYIADSAKKGLVILNNNSIEVVIADQKMPETTGIEFFELMIKLDLTPTRILLTGYSDINDVIGAINKGQVYRYLVKPWDVNDLKLTIENAYELYSLKKQNNELQRRYLKTLETSIDPVILFDDQAQIIDYNIATTNFFNITEPSSRHMFTSFFQDPLEAKRLTEILEKEGLIKGIECQLILKNNKIQKCLISVNKGASNSEGAIYYQAIIKDITI